MCMFHLLFQFLRLIKRGKLRKNPANIIHHLYDSLYVGWARNTSVGGRSSKRRIGYILIGTSVRILQEVEDKRILDVSAYQLSQ